MRIRPWPNGRGCDVGLTVPASMSVIEAVRLCRAKGERVR